MSLIHKALKKVEKPDVSDVSNMVTPEEGILAEESRASSISPRTIGLIILTILAAIFAIYMNFCAEKVPKKAKIPAVTPKPAAAVKLDKPVIQETAKRTTEPTGVSRNEQDMAVDALPEDAQLLNREGEKYFLAGDLDNALAKFEEALTKAPASSKILNSIGLVFKKTGRTDEAERYYNQAIKINPDCSECLNNLAVLKVDKGDNVSAVLYLKKANAVSETYADPYFNLAVIMEKEGNFKSAVDNYKKFLTYTTSEDADLKAKIRARIENLAMNWEE